MAVDGDNLWQDVVSQANQRGDAFSPEDVAWADSCLVKDSEPLDNNWSSITEAVLDILASQASSFDTLPPYVSNDDAPEMEADGASSIKELDESGKTVLQEFIGDDSHFKLLDFTESEIADVGSFWEESVDIMDTSEDIFKVWDMHFASEEDDFVKQLNRALADSAAFNGEGTPPDKLTFEDIISSMADLKLQQTSS